MDILVELITELFTSLFGSQANEKSLTDHAPDH